MSAIMSRHLLQLVVLASAVAATAVATPAASAGAAARAPRSWPAPAPPSKVTADAATRTYRDAYGRTLTFHGVNAVKKEAPFVPDTTAGAPFWASLNDGDAAQLRAWGFTAVRLGAMMQGTLLPPPRGSPPNTPPLVNASYVAALRGVVDTLWAHGVRTILDTHQDVLSCKVCGGDGFPVFLLPNNFSAAVGAQPFPWPFGDAKGPPFKWNASTGLPLNCSVLGDGNMAMTYLTDAVGKTFQALYDGRGPLAQAFAVHWAALAAAFAGHPGVLAYELINEPWMGDHWADLDLLVHPAKADLQNLQPFNGRTHAAIRAHDNDTVLMYEPAQWTNDVTSVVGYTEGPGGDAYADRQSLAFHNYCVLEPGTDGDGPQRGLPRFVCNVTDAITLNNRDADLRRLATPGFLTEFGAVDDSEDAAAEITYVAALADAQSPPLSWAYWNWKELSASGSTDALYYPGNFSVMRRKLLALARPHAFATAGTPRNMSWDAAHGGAFTFEFCADASIVAAPTEIWLGTDAAAPLHFGGGYNVTLAPQGAATWAATKDGITVSLSEAASAAVAGSLEARADAGARVGACDTAAVGPWRREAEAGGSGVLVSVRVVCSGSGGGAAAQESYV